MYKDFKAKVLAGIQDNKELLDLTKKLTVEEVDDNLPLLYNQIKDLEVCKKCNGKECFSDPRYLQPHLEYDGGLVHRVYKPCTFRPSRFNMLYMPPVEETGKVFRNENRAELLIEMERSIKGGKGIFIHGPFGCGKTYLMIKLAKKIAKEREVFFIYFPELINDIKSSISKSDDSYNTLIERLKKVDVLFLDDVGREQNTAFNRDQILGTILQYRAMYNLQTFMTSNYSIDLLQEHFSESKDGCNSLNSSGIIERIRYLMNEKKLNDSNYRKIMK